MTLEYFTGQMMRCDGEPTVALNPRGQIDISAPLVRLAGLKPGWVRLGYDRDKRLLVIEAVTERTRGAAKLNFSNGLHGRFSCNTALEYWHLRPAKRLLIVAQVRNGRIEVQLGGASEVAPAAEEHEDDDRGKTAALDNAIEHEDRNPPAAGPEKPEVRLSHKIRGKCQTCVRWAGGKCRSSKSPKANLATGAGDTCDEYFPRGAELPAAKTKRAAAAKSKGGPRDRIICPLCEEEVAAKVGTRLTRRHPHPGSGRPICLGSGKEGKPV